MSSNPTLPAVDRLGYAIDVSSITPMDISSVDNAVLDIRRLISFDQYDVRPVVIDGVTYDVPKSVSIQNDSSTTEGLFIHYPDGPQASAAFRADSSLSMRYFALSGPSSTVQATEKAFIRDKQYAFYNFSKSKYNVRLQDYAESLNERALLTGVTNLPKPFDGTNPTTLSQYRQFFERYGSHIIVSSNYGARYPLKTWGSNEDAEVNRMFTTNVKAAFSGIPSGGQFEAPVKEQSQYKTFLGYLQQLISVSGGDQSIANKLASNTATFPEYELWTDSTNSTQASLMSFRVVELWALMTLAANQELVSYADHLSNAFTYIVTTPEVYKTAVTLDIQTDWAEFNLLTPSAVIIPNSDRPYPSSNMVATDTRVQWGKEHSHQYDRMTLHFFVINDGSPIDFSISRGSLKTGGYGMAQVIMEGKDYVNDRITDDIWNTHWYYRAPVSSTPERRSSKRSSGPQSWDAVLHKYLVEIGERSL